MEISGITNLVIGLGQIGSAIQTILGCEGYDPKNDTPLPDKQYDCIHICFPYSDKFLEHVNAYIKSTQAKLIIIHSTVPVGTSRELKAVHSPCRGIHPNLVEGIRTFVKFFGGERASVGAEIFEAQGVKTFTTDKQEETEALKLWDTTIYGWNIILEKEIRKYCIENDLDFDVVYTLANHTYNTGYESLGHPEYKKYILRHYEGKIGGHCVIQNLPLLKGFVADTINEYNSTL